MGGLVVLVLMAAALGSVGSPQISLLCTSNPYGNVTRWVFTINPDDQTFTSMLNDKPHGGGTAEIAPETITLTLPEGRAHFLFRISRTTGDMIEDGYGAGSTSPNISFKGNCQKYEGKLF